MESVREHWDTIYSTKQPSEVSWTEEVPSVSLELIREIASAKDACIIDIGGGDSRLAEHLTMDGYSDITVLDVSEQALARAKARLGQQDLQVKWIVSDVLEFQSTNTYDIWHDRAMFHFLRDESDITRYVSVMHAALTMDGYAIIGTFSETGPEKCSGLTVTRYSAQSMSYKLGSRFVLDKHVDHVHTTPFGTTQNFLFCRFRKVG